MKFYIRFSLTKSDGDVGTGFDGSKYRHNDVIERVDRVRKTGTGGHHIRSISSDRLNLE